jgi:hypothetical protein
MKKKKNRKKKAKAVVLHQHRDKTQVFGKAHPVTRKHSNSKTQMAHDKTVELNGG